MHMKVVPTGCQGGLPVQPAARRQAPDAHHLLQLAGREGAMLVYSLAVLSCVLGAVVPVCCGQEMTGAPFIFL